MAEAENSNTLKNLEASEVCDYGVLFLQEIPVICGM